jgi:hypothetical protein
MGRPHLQHANGMNAHSKKMDDELNNKMLENCSKLAEPVCDRSIRIAIDPDLRFPN